MSRITFIRELAKHVWGPETTVSCGESGNHYIVYLPKKASYFSIWVDNLKNFRASIKVKLGFYATLSSKEVAEKMEEFMNKYYGTCKEHWKIDRYTSIWDQSTVRLRVDKELFDMGIAILPDNMKELVKAVEETSTGLKYIPEEPQYSPLAQDDDEEVYADEYVEDTFHFTKDSFFIVALNFK